MRRAKRLFFWFLTVTVLMGSWALGEEALPEEEESGFSREAVEAMVQDVKEGYFSDPEMVYAAIIAYSELDGE